jgi:hypothetical protein
MKRLHTVPCAHWNIWFNLQWQCILYVISYFTLNITSNVTNRIHANPITRFILEMSIFNHYTNLLHNLQIYRLPRNTKGLLQVAQAVERIYRVVPTWRGKQQSAFAKHTPCTVKKFKNRLNDSDYSRLSKGQVSRNRD